MTVVDCLDICTGSIVAVAGCGGKTSLIERAADRLRDRKVLVSTTAKIFPMKTEGVMLCENMSQCEEHKPQPGIQCFGLLNAASRKLEPLPDHVLAGLIPRYDVTFLEADGSRGLPCKGWLPNEPVIPPYCTHTVGVLTMSALGKAASETVVHRLPQFLSLTGQQQGEPITVQSLEAMACAPGGMFKNSAGQRYLLVNQVEDEPAARTARSYLQIIKEKYPNRFEKLLFGSVHLDAWQEV